ncbi:hypothetical protein JTE90_003931 [Oedothorax gibbosus]|uniref:Uncharacterized protein n=1 Tax=Oedothorax gibbosus TaxID=931172 RepID=A0AAV6UYU5_9ARAC|nr:hypothetical protein JTE90_003931 [Oedothorax gibbosus]
MVKSRNTLLKEHKSSHSLHQSLKQKSMRFVAASESRNVRRKIKKSFTADKIESSDNFASHLILCLACFLEKKSNYSKFEKAILSTLRNLDVIFARPLKDELFELRGKCLRSVLNEDVRKLKIGKNAEKVERIVFAKKCLYILNVVPSLCTS